jgi:hypothetical protein
MEGIPQNTTTTAHQGETEMDLLAALPEWLVWCAAGGAGALALAAVASIIEAALDLDAR